MRHPRAIRAIWTPRYDGRLAVTGLRLLSLLALVLVTSIAIGCGAGRKGGEATTAAGGGTSTATSTSNTNAATGNDSEERYAHRELASIPLRELQKCPESGSAVSWAVRYHGKRAKAWCGTGSAVVRVGSTTMNLRNGWCSLETSGYVSYYFGANIADPTVSVNQREILYGPKRLDITLGLTPNYQPAKRDGTYVDAAGGPSKAKYGISIIVSGNGKTWANDEFDHTTTVTLTHQRTRGSFSATDSIGGSMSGTFRCGSVITGDAAPLP
jgi:hypothetical protein